MATGFRHRIETLIGSLERQRRTLFWKCADLDAAGLRATTAATTMTLGGLLKHLALVEADYFCVKLLGQDSGPPWKAVDWDAEPDWEWRTAAEDTPEELYVLWENNVARAAPTSPQRWPTATQVGSPSSPGRTGQSPSIRRMLVDVIEEYARHTGHADLLRESVDGLVGEDPPS